MNKWEIEPVLPPFEVCGYLCEIKRHDRLGHLCGYVTVPFGHPAYTLTYFDPLLEGIEVHGGLTYSDNGKHGFDCAHGWDYVPTVDSSLKSLGHASDSPMSSAANYKTLGFVVDQVISLAVQLKTLEVHHDS
jgi:hypothetical protein